MGGRLMFGRTTEQGNRILIECVKALSKAVPRDGLKLDKPNRVIKCKGKVVVAFDEQNVCEWKDLDTKSKAAEQGFEP